MSTQTFEESAHPREQTGKFATKPVSDAAGGLDALAAPAPEPTVFTMKYDSVDDKIAAFRVELDAHVAGLDSDENWRNYLDTMSKFHRYSMTNQLLIAMQCPGATRVAGFRKWQEVDRSVMKGEKAISIFAPKTVRATEKDSDNKVVTGPDGKPVKRSRVVGFTTAAVFDISQTQGADLPGNQLELTETPPEGFIADLETAIAGEGFQVLYEDLPGEGHHGYTSPGRKVVVIDSKISEGSRAATLAHELGHIKAGHLDRMDEYHQGHGGSRGAMEVEAESISYAVCRAAGMETPQDTAATYVAGWGAVQRDSDVIRKSGERIQKSVHQILTSGSFRFMEETPVASEPAAQA